MGRRLIDTAYHEAGHAVVAWNYDLLVGTVTIVPDETTGNLGVALHEECDDWRENIVILLSGITAELKHRKRISNRITRISDMRDFFVAVTDEAERMELQAESVRIVGKHWFEVEALAAALIENKTLNGDEVRLVIEAMAEGYDWAEVLNEYRRRFGSLPTS